MKLWSKRVSLNNQAKRYNKRIHHRKLQTNVDTGIPTSTSHKTLSLRNELHSKKSPFPTTTSTTGMTSPLKGHGEGDYDELLPPLRERVVNEKVITASSFFFHVSYHGVSPWAFVTVRSTKNRNCPSKLTRPHHIISNHGVFSSCIEGHRGPESSTKNRLFDFLWS